MIINSFFHYLQYEKRYSLHTIDAYRRDLEQFFSFTRSFYEISEPTAITHFHIRSYMVDLMNQEFQPRSINRKLSSLKALFRFMMKKGVIQKNPALKVVGPKVGKTLPAFINEDRIDGLLDSSWFTEDFPGVRDRLIIEMLYHTGMRRAELIKMTISDVDLLAMTVKVMGKRGKERIIPIGKELGALINQYLSARSEVAEASAGNVLMLTDKGKPAYPKLIYYQSKKIFILDYYCKKKESTRVAPLVATHLANGGADLNAVKELLGHASLAATQVYTHNSIEQFKAVYEKAHHKAKSKE